MGNSCTPQCCSTAEEKACEAGVDLSSDHAPVYSYRHQTPAYSERQLQQASPRDLPRLLDSVQSLSQEDVKKAPAYKSWPEDEVQDEEGAEFSLKTWREHEKSSEPSVEVGPKPDSPACLDSEGTVMIEPVLEVCSNPVIETVIEVAPQTNAPALELVFDASGQTRHLVLQRRPLGAEFFKSLLGPVKVRKVHPNSYAAELGLQPGWVIKSVGSEHVSNESLAHTQIVLNNGLMALPERSKH